MFADLEQRIDEAAFDRLADDTAAIWTPRGGEPVGPVRVILEDVEKPGILGATNLPQEAHVVRVLASEVERLAPGVKPGEGDAFTLHAGKPTERVLVVRGQPWRDQGDWVAAVSDGA